MKLQDKDKWHKTNYQLQAIGAGAFGGAREGIQRAELQRATQANIGQALQSGFGQALGATQAQQGFKQVHKCKEVNC